MGFFDNVLKAVNKAVETVEKFQDNANATYASPKSETPKASAPTVSESGKVLPAESICKPEGIPSRVCHTEIFDSDADGREAKITLSMEIDKRFHEFGSGALEIDVSYSYTPDITDDSAYADWDIGNPYISAGFEGMLYDIVEAYKDGKALPKGSTICEITGNDRISYKTTLEKGDSCYVAYHYKRGFDTRILYQFEVCYPTSFKGKPIEEIMLNALKLMAATYTEAASYEN